MQNIGISKSIAEPLASVGAGINFAAGEISPISPVDAASAVSNIPEVPSMIQAARARQAELQPDAAPSADTVVPTAQPQMTQPVRVPDAVQNVPTSFLSNPERLRQARGAAREGKEATGFISYTP